MNCFSPRKCKWIQLLLHSALTGFELLPAEATERQNVSCFLLGKFILVKWCNLETKSYFSHITKSSSNEKTHLRLFMLEWSRACGSCLCLRFFLKHGGDDSRIGRWFLGWTPPRCWCWCRNPGGRSSAGAQAHIQEAANFDPCSENL